MQKPPINAEIEKSCYGPPTDRHSRVHASKTIVFALQIQGAVGANDGSFDIQRSEIDSSLHRTRVARSRAQIKRASRDESSSCDTQRLGSHRRTRHRLWTGNGQMDEGVVAYYLGYPFGVLG